VQGQCCAEARAVLTDDVFGPGWPKRRRAVLRLGTTVQERAGQLGQAGPIRRVFGTVVFRAREHGFMPPPGDTRPARLTVELHDVIWETLYAPLVVGTGFAADRLNRLQFLTIRQFLSLVFGALVILLLVLAVWP